MKRHSSIGSIMITNHGVGALRGWQPGKVVQPSGSKEQGEEIVWLSLARAWMLCSGELCHTRMQTRPPALSVSDPWSPAEASFWPTLTRSQEIGELMGGRYFIGAASWAQSRAMKSGMKIGGKHNDQDRASGKTKETGGVRSLSDAHGCWGGTDQFLGTVPRLEMCAEDQVQREGHLSMEEWSPKRLYRKKPAHLFSRPKDKQLLNCKSG